MKLVFVSNFMNHHQLEMCNRLSELCDDFKFLCTKETPQSVLNFGYNDLSSLPYVVLHPKTEQEEKDFIKIIMEADAVVFGDCPLEYVRMRLLQDKLSFIFSERMWKKGYYRRFIPTIRKKVSNKFLNKSNLYVLGASCYLAGDLKLVGFPVEKCFTWGYFPPFEELDVQRIMENKHEKIHIVWAGRFIPLKHCQDVLYALGKVKRAGYDFVFDLVGDGECRKEYEQIVEKENLTENIKFWGSLSQEQVRDVMKQAHIFIFSSDFNEGWGAVVNEAMNSLCAPIVSHAVGASAFLINNMHNGLIYRSGDVSQLSLKIEELIKNQSFREKLSENAYWTLKTQFNGTEAANRLVHFCDCVLNGNELPVYESGPMSLSPVIKNNWFKG